MALDLLGTDAERVDGPHGGAAHGRGEGAAQDPRSKTPAHRYTVWIVLDGSAWKVTTVGFPARRAAHPTSGTNGSWTCTTSAVDTADFTLP